MVTAFTESGDTDSEIDATVTLDQADVVSLLWSGSIDVSLHDIFNTDAIGVAPSITICTETGSTDDYLVVESFAANSVLDTDLLYRDTPSDETATCMIVVDNPDSVDHDHLMINLTIRLKNTASLPDDDALPAPAGSSWGSGDSIRRQRQAWAKQQMQTLRPS